MMQPRKIDDVLKRARDGPRTGKTFIKRFCILPINSTCSNQTGFNWAETASKARQWRTQVVLDVISYFSGNFSLNVDFSL